MIDILSYLPGKRKQTPSGWISFNAVCCEHNGNNQDRRQRGGLKTSAEGWSYHCFNCGYTASFIMGRNLSFKARKLLKWLGVTENDIEHLNLESLKHRNIHGIVEDRRRTWQQLASVEFEERDLPPFAELLTDQYTGYQEYILSRGVSLNYPYMIQPNNDGVHWTRPHIVIPFTHDDKIVGYTCRFIDDKSPKFISDSQPGYVFGTDLQKDNWQYTVVVEGIFDALSINALAVMHNDISDQQAQLIRTLGKEVIVVPDQDRAGLALINRAVELNWSVSIPPWPADVKDVNDSVVKYGRVATMLMIMENRCQGKIKIDMARRRLEKKLA
jgi:hypothetical protein